ncbi:hypothetical protein D3C71_1825340 [compost metagenome]
MQPLIELRITHVHHRASARRLAVQPTHAGAVVQHIGQQPHLPKHVQAAGLQQEPGADRTRRGGTLEHVYIVMIA